MRRPVLVIMIVLVALGVLPPGAAPCASACSCATDAISEQLAGADVVVRGVVVRVDRPWWPTSSAATMRYTVDPTHVWRGPEHGPLTVTTAVNEASCGLPDLAEGQDVVIAGRSDRDRVAIGLCGASGPATDVRVAAVTELLGVGRPTVAGPTPPAPQHRGIAVVAGAAGLVLVAAAVGLLVRRRRAR